MTSRKSSVAGSNWQPRAKLDDSGALLKAVVNERVLTAGSDVLLQGQVPTVAHVLLQGHTYRYRLLDDGRRQITAVMMPGEVCDLEAAMRGQADYSVGALTRCLLGEIPVNKVADPTTVDPEMTRVLLRRLLRDEAISREWLVGMGCRSAFEKVAHLICEFRVRSKAVGLTTGGSFGFPFTQAQLGDILGLSTVHTNRVLQYFRNLGLISYTRNTMSILEIGNLETLAGFNSSYLRLN